MHNDHNTFLHYILAINFLTCIQNTIDYINLFLKLQKLNHCKPLCQLLNVGNISNIRLCLCNRFSATNDTG